MKYFFGFIIILSVPIFAQLSGTIPDSTDIYLRSSLIHLPWAETEINQAAAQYKGERFCYEEATESTFKHLAPDARIIHLATHAVVDDANPLESRLIFAEDTASNEDGFLYAYELYNMNLNADLAVLSACNTGYGKLIRGEGIMSLARGFMYSGCPGILMSLWPVDDETTAHLMKSFYQGLDQGLSKDEALRAAKLQLLKTGHPAKANPYYWAGFVSIGNKSPLPKSHSKYYTIGWVLAIGLCIGLIQIIKYKSQKH